MKLRNFTPHDPLTAVLPDGTRLVLPQEGMARCEEHHVETGVVSPDLPMPTTEIRYGDVTGLPEPEEGVFLIVSQLVVQALPERHDVGFPAGLVRNEVGDIVGFSMVGVAAGV